MTSSDNTGTRRITRRCLFHRAAGLGCVAAVIAAGTQPASAQKMTQQAAEYQDHPKDGQQCSGCALFEPPAACKLVDGRIAPQGWCKLFVKKTSG